MGRRYVVLLRALLLLRAHGLRRRPARGPGRRRGGHPVGYGRAGAGLAQRERPVLGAGPVGDDELDPSGGDRRGARAQGPAPRRRREVLAVRLAEFDRALDVVAAVDLGEVGAGVAVDAVGRLSTLAGDRLGRARRAVVGLEDERRGGEVLDRRAVVAL